MRVLVNSASNFLKAHGVSPREGWRHAEARAPTQASMLVFKEEAVRHVAFTKRRRRTACVSYSSLVDHELSHSEEESNLTLCVPFEIPARFAHQKSALDAILGPDYTHARSGIVRSPCGSGKSHIGVQASLHIRRPVLVVTPSHEANQEWVRTYAMYGVRPHVCGQEKRITSDAQPAVVVITYRLLVCATTRPIHTLSYESLLVGNVWDFGLVIFDEVWTLPASTHMKAAALIPAKVRIGLTADERRRDGQQDAITSFVGPMLFDLSVDDALCTGVIASVSRRVMVVSMSDCLRDAYDAANCENKHIMSILNPQKIQAMSSVMAATSCKKIIVYCDKLNAIPYIADLLCRTNRVPFVGVLSGSSSSSTRKSICKKMRGLPSAIAIFSRVGNAAIDLPDVDLIIEISVVDRSAQQKTQRDGRAQRFDERKGNSSIVTIVTHGTREEAFARHRAEEARGSSTEWHDVPYVEACHCPWTDSHIIAWSSASYSKGKADGHQEGRMERKSKVKDGSNDARDIAWNQAQSEKRKASEGNLVDKRARLALDR